MLNVLGANTMSHWCSMVTVMVTKTMVAYTLTNVGTTMKSRVTTNCTTMSKDMVADYANSSWCLANAIMSRPITIIESIAVRRSHRLTLTSRPPLLDALLLGDSPGGVRTRPPLPFGAHQGPELLSPTGVGVEPALEGSRSEELDVGLGIPAQLGLLGQVAPRGRQDPGHLQAVDGPTGPVDGGLQRPHGQVLDALDLDLPHPATPASASHRRPG